MEFHYHRRNLPHFYIQNSTYFITFRLKGSIPNSKLEALLCLKKQINSFDSKEEMFEKQRKYFNKYDEILHENHGMNFLQNDEIAKCLFKLIKSYDSVFYNLIALTIMPNHVHIILRMIDKSKNLGKILQTLKRMSAYHANKILKKRGKFWQSESYDHIIRNENELNNSINYVINNPVKAKLVENWINWKYTYCMYDIR